VEAENDEKHRKQKEQPFAENQPVFEAKAPDA